MANDIEPALTGPHGDASAELEGIGAAMMLLAAGVLGVALAALLQGFHMVWVPLLSPVVIGWAIGSTLAFIQRRFQVRAATTVWITTVLGATIAYAGYHVLVYDRILGFIAENLPSGLEAALADPRLQVMAWLEERTGHTGLMAYLSFVSEGAGAGVSPLGLFGRLEPGLALTCLMVVVDGALAMASALFFVRMRGLGTIAAARADRRVREIIARTDARVLSQVMRHIDQGDVETAARCLAEQVEAVDYAVALVYDPFAQDDWELQILSVGPTGADGVRTSRRMDSWHGQAFLDELKLAQESGAGPTA